MRILSNIFALWFLSVASTSMAEEAQQQPDIFKFTQNLQQYVPSIKPDSVKLSPVSGLYEVIVGPKVYYISPDARYLMTASIIDLKAGKNLTMPKVYKARQDALDGIGEANMITFYPEKPEFIVTAFTDIDCGYCRKMHNEMGEYNKLGIGIRYLFYPRAGIGSASFKTARSVWCQKDQKKALTDAKAGKKIESKDCKNPLEDHMQLVKQLGLRGTPALILPSGELIESYIPAAELQKLLRSRASK